MLIRFANEHLHPTIKLLSRLPQWLPWRGRSLQKVFEISASGFVEEEVGEVAGLALAVRPANIQSEAVRLHRWKAGKAPGGK